MQNVDTQTHRPVAQRIAAGLAALARRPLWFLVALALLAVPAWLLARPCLTQRVMSVDLVVKHAGPHWAVDWQRADNGTVNGAWLDLHALLCSETLEIRTSGQPHDPDRGFELWLYNIIPHATGKPINLKRLHESALNAVTEGSWVLPPPGVPGIVCNDHQPGLLRVDLPPGGVTLEGAKTATGGEVTFCYADQVRTIDMYASPDEAFTERFARGQLPDNYVLPVRQPLPNYALGNVRLVWTDAAETTVTLSRVCLRETLLGRRIRVRNLVPLAGPGTTLVSDDRASFRFTAEGPDGAVVFPVPARLGSRINGVGYVFTFVFLVVACAVVRALWRAFRKLPAALRSLDALAMIAVVAAHLWMADWAPCILAPDSIDYVHSAYTFLQSGNLEHIHPGRVPGYSVFLAWFIDGFRDFATATGRGQALLGILTSLMAWDMLRRTTARPWPAIGLLLVGFSPLALMYEHIMLSECLAAFGAVLAAWLLVVLIAHNARPTASWPLGLVLAVLLGLTAGLAPYVRANLQLVVVLAPPILVLCAFRPRRRLRCLVQAGLVAGVGLGCIVPWVARNHKITGRWEFIIGKQYQRLEEASKYPFELADDNQTRVFGYDHWRSIRRRLVDEHYYAIPLELNSSRLFEEIDTAPPRSPATIREELCQPVIDESLARRPWRAWRGRIAAFITQIGVWNKFPQSRAENAYWSLALRGDLRPNSFCNTNLTFNLDDRGIIGPVENWAQEVGSRIRQDITHVVDSPEARLFNEWFWTGQALAPLCGVLFLIGMGLALWRGDYTMLGIGLFPLANATALAVLVISNIERYSVPFNVLMIVVAVYTLSVLATRKGVPADARPTPADAALG
jgi:hypothetical protein